jgi:NADH-quinone oxidoreductase subunit H
VILLRDIDMTGTIALLLQTASSKALPQPTGSGGDFWIDYILIPVIKIVIVVAVVLFIVAYLTYMERKVSAFMQSRLGPMRVGPWGLLQPVADGLKVFLKEDLIPLKADRIVFWLAPVIVMMATVLVLAVIPWGPAWATVANINIGLLFILGVSSVGVLGLVLAGWSSNSKYSLLGGLRASAQMVSYEVGMGLSIIGALMFARTLSMSGIIEAQQADHGMWYVFFQPTGFIIYLICALGETNRAPFDLPEAESELVAGYQTEYSGMRFSIFYMAEYTSLIVTAAIATTVFLGGWSFFGVETLIKNQILQGIFGIIIFLTKTIAVIYAYMWFRWTFPRYRYDQLMDIGWKWQIPAGLANIVLTGVFILLAMPKSEGGVFGLMERVNGRLEPTWGGVLYFIFTGFAITTPIIWGLLGAINRRSRDFNLHEQRQLQIELKKKRLERQAESAGTE